MRALLRFCLLWCPCPSTNHSSPEKNTTNGRFRRSCDRRFHPLSKMSAASFALAICKKNYLKNASKEAHSCDARTQS